MSEKIIMKSASNKVRGIKLNDILTAASNSENLENQQKEIEIELHNHFIKGFNEGKKEATNRLQKEYSEKIKEVYSIIESITSKIDTQLTQQLNSINGFVIQLSFQIAEKIIRREIEKESPILKIIDEAMKKLSSANQAVVKINPGDYTLLDLNLLQLNKKFNSSHIRIEADERIEKGGCLIETEIGNADGRVTSQIENIKRQIETYFEGSNA
jgi:flagellar assembly protein FliH